MKVAIVQHDVAWEDKVQTLARLEPLVEAAAADGARLVVLTEMFSTGFSMDTGRVVEAEGGPAASFLVRLSRATGASIAGSLAYGADSSSLPTNRFVCASPDGSLAIYDKIHPFSYGGEAEHYSPGSSLCTFTLEGLRFTPFVCYDLRFGDCFWSSASETDCYLVVANWPAARQAHWRSLLVARAIENQAYVLGSNRVGDGGGISYVGGSIALDPSGTVLAEAGAEATTLVLEIDADRVAAQRTRYPFLADRRTIVEGGQGAARP